MGRCHLFDIGQTRPGQVLISKKSTGFRQKLAALVAEFAFGEIHGVAARAESTHPLSTFAAKFDTRGILVSASRAFHGELLSKAAELKMGIPISSLLVGGRKNRILASFWMVGRTTLVTSGIAIFNFKAKKRAI
jgi:hypothetical protein